MPDMKLIDQIYEAAILPELWPRVLDGVAALSGSAGTVLFTTDHKSVARWTSSDAIVPVIEGFIKGGWSTRNPRDTPATRRLGFARFGSDLDLLTPEEREQDPMYTDLLAPLGFGWFAGTHIAIPSGDVAVFDVERRTESGPMARADLDRLDALRPHLGRAAVLSTRLGLERARAAVDALATMGLPAAVLASGGRALAANSLFQALHAQVAIEAYDRVRLLRPAAQARLAAALARVDSAREAGVSIALPAVDLAPAAVAHLLPVSGMAHDVFAQARALLIITPLALAAAPSAELLGGLFDLTPAEARIARAIADGATVAACAASLGLSRETVRTQLKAALAKTGSDRQSDLVRLLGGLAPRASTA